MVVVPEDQNLVNDCQVQPKKLSFGVFRNVRRTSCLTWPMPKRLKLFEDCVFSRENKPFNFYESGSIG